MELLCLLLLGQEVVDMVEPVCKHYPSSHHVHLVDHALIIAFVYLVKHECRESLLGQIESKEVVCSINALSFDSGISHV